jgi:hypothetical protein
MAVMARIEKMLRVDLTGLSLSEAEAEVAALIDEAQEAALRDYEITMVDLGCIGSSAIDRELARRRAELETTREELLGRLRAFIKRGGKKLQ